MTNQEKLHARILNHESIVLSRGNEIFKSVVNFIAVFSIILFSIVFFHFKISIISLVTLFFISSLAFLLIKNKKKYVTVTIKGEMLMLKDANNQHKVMPVKSIKSIFTYTLFGVNYTRITYKLDGRKHEICLLKKLNGEQLENEEIIKEAMKVA